MTTRKPITPLPSVGTAINSLQVDEMSLLARKPQNIVSLAYQPGSPDWMLIMEKYKMEIEKDSLKEEW
jgi:hypothetical protein